VVAVIARQAGGRSGSFADLPLPDSLDGPDVPRLMLIPGGRAGTARRVVSSSRMVTPAALRAKAHALAPMESFPDNAVISGPVLWWVDGRSGYFPRQTVGPGSGRPRLRSVPPHHCLLPACPCHRCRAVDRVAGHRWCRRRRHPHLLRRCCSRVRSVQRSGEPGQPPCSGQAWTVRPGDTLWGLVEAAGVAGDPRPVVDQLSAELRGQPLQVGEVVTIP